MHVVNMYLVFDRIRGLHVRSGKVCPRPFHSRIAEHKSGAASANLAMNASRFYRSYPTKAAAAGLEGTRKGFFEDLKFQVALGFDPAQFGGHSPRIGGARPGRAAGGRRHQASEAPWRAV